MAATKFEYEIYTLSDIFYSTYNPEMYPEILNKNERPYSCLLIETMWDFFICIPYRTDIRHKQAYKFKTTLRAQNHESGLDYSKMVIIKKMEYLECYIKHQRGVNVLAPAMFERKYKFSTLKYFHEELMLY